MYTVCITVFKPPQVKQAGIDPDVQKYNKAPYSVHSVLKVCFLCMCTKKYFEAS